MLILGFGHKARHGQGLAATAIKDFYDERNHVFSKYGRHLAKLKVGIFKFATALYTEVNDAIEYDHGNVQEVFKRYNTPEWVTEELDPEFSAMAPYGKHPKLLQWWGTEYRRAQYPDYWVDKLSESIPGTLDMVLITDVRFANEAQCIKNRGGYNVKVERLDASGLPYVAPDRPADHPSETALDFYKFDFYITTPDGHKGLTCEMAITLAEYLRGQRNEAV
jgi:hypothetical protein